MKARSFASLWSVYTDNLTIYLLPTSHYWPNDMVDRFPWREAYDKLFSGALLRWAVIAAAALAFARSWPRWRAALAVACPVVYVFLVSVMAERGENMRFKLFLEPTFYVLVVSQAYHTGRLVNDLIRRRIRSYRQSAITVS